MEPNQNPPSEREWTIQEQEEFFASVDAITSIPNGSMVGSWASNGPLSWNIEDLLHSLYPSIHVTHIVSPEQGWPVAYHCPLCSETVFVLSLWAAKPTVDGKEFEGYHKLKEMCAHETLGFEHNMKLGMKGYNTPIDLKSGGLLL